ncbi:type II toxin-antitoxin system VapC family toxin, partial [Methanosarcinales archaeon]
DRIILSSIVVAELYAGVKGEEEQFILDSFVSLFPVVHVTAEIARYGGLYKRDYGKSHGVGLADAILAATAELEGAELKTLNVKHYPMFKGVRPAYKKY